MIVLQMFIEGYYFLIIQFINQRNRTFFFFFISRKNILKEPQENMRPTKEYREGHKQREKKKKRKEKRKQ